jgi:hypothetical protein
MALSFQVYTDPALSVPLVGGLLISQAADGSSPPVQNQLYIGSTLAGKVLQSKINPGVDPIVLSVEDISPGTGHVIQEVKLALLQVDLGAAVAGASLDIGHTVNSGVLGALSFWVEVNDSTGTNGTAIELSITSNELTEP